MHRVISSDLVVSDTFVFRLVAICKEFTLGHLLSESLDAGLLLLNHRLLSSLFVSCGLFLILLLSLFALLFLTFLGPLIFAFIRVGSVIGQLVLHTADLMFFISLPSCIESCGFFLSGALIVFLARYLFGGLTHCSQRSLRLHHLRLFFYLLVLLLNLVDYMQR